MKNALIVLGVIVVAGLIYLGVKSMYSPPVSTTSDTFTSSIPTSSSGLPMTSPGNLISPSASESPSDASNQEVSITNFKFVPATLTVKQGSTVVFTNNDSVVHTVTSASFDSGSIQPGGTFSQVFSQKGTFAYNCTPHPTMTGTIIVQ